MFRIRFLMPLLALLPACGGSAGLEGEGASPAAAAVRGAAFGAMAGRLEDAAFSADLPQTGSASYAGYIGATASAPGVGAVFLTAETELTAQFGAGTISGTFGNVIATGGGVSVSGSGTFGNGVIGVAGFDADVDGAFVAGGESYSISGTLDGAFLGAGAEALGGVLDADLHQGASAVGTLTGEVWAER